MLCAQRVPQCARDSTRAPSAACARKSGAAGGALGQVFPGIGQWYAEEYARGTLIAAVYWTGFAMYKSSEAPTVTTRWGGGLMLGGLVVGAIDGAFALKRYNRRVARYGVVDPCLADAAPLRVGCQRKSPAAGAALGLLIPGAGHWFAEEYGRGAIASAATWAGLATVFKDGAQHPWPVGEALLIGGFGMSIIDGALAARRYNMRISVSSTRGARGDAPEIQVGLVAQP
jgi:hypothetical protein